MLFQSSAHLHWLSYWRSISSLFIHPKFRYRLLFPWSYSNQPFLTLLLLPENHNTLSTTARPLLYPQSTPLLPYVLYASSSLVKHFNTRWMTSQKKLCEVERDKRPDGEAMPLAGSYMCLWACLRTRRVFRAEQAEETEINQHVPQVHSPGPAESLVN